MSKRKPKILLLGDSIRISYQDYVRDNLKDIADVIAPSENCEHTLITLSRLDIWLEEAGNVDLILWNNGLHDVGRNPFRAPVQIKLEDYKRNLEFILMRLKNKCGNIIWAGTTPVHPESQLKDDQWSWRNEEIDEYNKAASIIMKANDIPIVDLNRTVRENYDEYLSDDKLHLSEIGSKLCADIISEKIISHLINRGYNL